jgi:tetratricopeptide (TPR) repeat protein
MRAAILRSSCLALFVLAAAAAGAAPTVDELLALKVEGMSEGDRLQNAAYCLEAGQQAREQGKFGTALDLFNKTLELNDEAVEAHWQKFILLSDDRVGLRTQAASELRLFLATNPNDAIALTELANLYQMKGKIAEALEQSKLAVSKGSPDPYPSVEYGQLLIAFTDRVQEGIDYEKAGIARGATEPWPLINLAWGYVRLGKYSDARANATKAIALLRKMGLDQPVNEMNDLIRSIEGK